MPPRAPPRPKLGNPWWIHYLVLPSNKPCQPGRKTTFLQKRLILSVKLLVLGIAWRFFKQIASGSPTLLWTLPFYQMGSNGSFCSHPFSPCQWRVRVGQPVTITRALVSASPIFCTVPWPKLCAERSRQVTARLDRRAWDKAWHAATLVPLRIVKGSNSGTTVEASCGNLKQPP